MAREVIVRMTDDLDRTKLAEETRDLTFEGFVYTLDLTLPNLEKLRKALQPWLDAAHEKKRQVGAPKMPPPPVGLSRSALYKATKGERDKMRAWGRANGFDVGEKGYVPKPVVEAYNAAQGGTLVHEGGKPHGK